MFSHFFKFFKSLFICFSNNEFIFLLFNSTESFNVSVLFVHESVFVFLFFLEKFGLVQSVFMGLAFLSIGASVDHLYSCFLVFFSIFDKKSLSIFLFQIKSTHSL
jgi:hypothetical protein